MAKKDGISGKKRNHDVEPAGNGGGGVQISQEQFLEGLNVDLAHEYAAVITYRTYASQIIQAEVALDDDVVVTLKAKSAFGVLPDVAWDAVPEPHRPQVRAALERVLDSAFRETPVSVIDQCRNAATVVLSGWLVAQGRTDMAGKDLAVLAKAMEQHAKPMHCAAWLGQTIARLHVRGKSNEQQAKALRLPTEEDAELSLHGLGFLLRDVGWAAA